MGVAFAGIVAVTGLSWTTLLLLVLAVFSIILSAIDFDVQRLPNVLVLTFAVAAGVVIVAATITEDDWVQLVRALVGAGSLGLFYVIAFVIYPRGLGFGDVKLSPVLGGVLAYFGWHQLVVGAFAGFLWGALVGIGAMVVTRKVRRVRIPFGPWMFLGTWTGIIVGAMVGDWYLHHVLSF